MGKIELVPTFAVTLVTASMLMFFGIFLISITTPITLDSQNNIYDALNESNYVISEDIIAAKSDSGTIIINVPTFMWLIFFIIVLISLGLSIGLQKLV